LTNYDVPTKDQFSKLTEVLKVIANELHDIKVSVAELAFLHPDGPVTWNNPEFTERPFK